MCFRTRDYNATVLDHYRRPRLAGDLPGATGVGEAGNAEDGDFLRLAVRIEGERVIAVRYRTLGCPAAIASASMAATLLEGRSLIEALALRNLDVVEALGGLPEGKERCSVLAEEAFRAAVRDHFRRLGRSGPPGTDESAV